MCKGALAALFLTIIFSFGAQAQCAPGSLAVIVNKASPVESLSMAQLRKLILGDVRNWPDRRPVTVILREPSSKPAQCVLSNVVRLSDAEYHRYLLNAEFRGEDPMQVQTGGSDALISKVVSSSAGAIGVVDMASLAAISGAVKVVHIDGKLPGGGIPAVSEARGENQQ